MKVGDALPKSDIERVTKISISAGNVFRVDLDKADGITPKPGCDSKWKYFVILGVDCDGIVYGGVVFNTKVNQNIPQARRDYHLPIDHTKYDFLSHKCFIDCSNVICASQERLTIDMFLGNVDQEDLGYMLDAVRECPTISKKQKERFGIL